LSDVLSEQPYLEIRERKRRVNWLTWKSQCIFSLVDASGPSKLEEVFRDNFIHPLDVEASLLAPKLFFEAF
jgi:hypothetical protein